ncbi:collagen-like triple helix repeat-containing protein [Ligilactobacillus salivarius]|uniref:Collagen-like protein n=1 Tax=Ligilactobacillus salivarius TaxID=1624 RepID=A0A1V9QR56_9LACO|nr:collagen-like protein [Ligilactobacillus salivarius]OQQ80555.1 hypothetical protein B6U60_10260 [Ligilactobacillus salivarius]OQQ83325.1 hypothetical protein B6U59_10045 [Ligilactobacillus salivarius]
MKTLTINQKVFKHQDTQTKLKIALFENDSRVSLDSNSEYQFKIKNSSGYLKSETLTIEDNRLVLTTDKLKDLPPDTYNFEVWQNEDSIYPSENYGYFSITKNTTEVDGEVVPVITIENFEKRFDEAVKNAKGDKGERGPQGEKGDKGDTGERGADGVDGKSAYQIWLDLGNSGSEQDFINSLKAQSERHAPMGYILDTRTKPWSLLFDNGCRVVNSKYWNNGAVFRPHSESGTWWDKRYPTYSIPDTIMKFIRGSIIASEFKVHPWTGGYFTDETQVLSPINNGANYDWTGVASDPVSQHNRMNFVRVLYEIGVWNDETVESLGAVRK